MQVGSGSTLRRSIGRHYKVGRLGRYLGRYLVKTTEVGIAAESAAVENRKNLKLCRESGVLQSKQELSLRKKRKKRRRRRNNKTDAVTSVKCGRDG